MTIYLETCVGKVIQRREECSGRTCNFDECPSYVRFTIIAKVGSREEINADYIRKLKKELLGMMEQEDERRSK